MKKSSNHWSMSVQEVVLNQSFSFLRKWMSMERMPTPCLCIWRKSSHSPLIMPWLLWLTQSLSSGVPSTEMMSPGILKSSWLVPMAIPTNVTAEAFKPLTLRQTSGNYLRRSSKVDTPWLSATTRVVNQQTSCWSVYHVILQHMYVCDNSSTLHLGCSAILLNEDTPWNLFVGGSFWWKCKRLNLPQCMTHITNIFTHK